MSTTFEVYPGRQPVPTFEELLALAQRRLNEQLWLRGVQKEFELRCELREGRTHDVVPVPSAASFQWPDGRYAWIFVPQHGGGTDVTSFAVGDDEVEFWNDVLADHEPARLLADKVRACLEVGLFWMFRRSAGQPPIINFAYGIIAAALAELTDGIVFSDDSAWDYARFPATARQVYDWYFVPHRALEKKYAQWAENNLSCLKGSTVD
ncbi:hypothetical protein [Piscinibacter terrae]|uniref:Uncharacterized protein n=1 Tax=Piscinibacter terrae TaxID=2496871 RepID=A0A3N7JQ09_9BURK|nr:hypothetical protein [Albitalea terrae]RQP23129.1 hypothetical protein DZC73_18600 [Albitalea terrae]